MRGVSKAKVVVSREVTVTKPYLHLPVRYDANCGLMRILIAGVTQQKFAVNYFHQKKKLITFFYYHLYSVKKN